MITYADHCCLLQLYVHIKVEILWSVTLWTNDIAKNICEYLNRFEDIILIHNSY